MTDLSFPCSDRHDNFRLRQHSVPINYDLGLDIDMHTFTYTAYEYLTIKTLKKTSCIELHAEELNITSIKIQKVDTSNTNFLEWRSRDITIETNYNATFHTLKLLFNQALESDTLYRLTFLFNAPLRDDLRGFYKSVYIDEHGNKEYIATTQFESIAARTAFPCYDEPAFKASFNLTLRVNDLRYKTILSNMPPISDITEGSYRTVRFAPTPNMSTYLLAFIVGNFDKVSHQTERLTYNVYTPVGRRHEGEFALNVAVNVTQFYEQFFNVDYPLPKLDMIAIPDFRAGAMENWGLITYRTTRLLGAEGMSQTRRQDIAYVVAHEIAHQWAGDLTTTRWWNSIFLNEGFARFFQHFSIDTIYPEWNSWELFLSRYLQPMLEYDTLPSIHPVLNDPINSQSQIEAMFDVITYGKGAAILRLYQEYLPPSTFQKWMREYFDSHQYGNVDPTDLFSALAPYWEDATSLNDTTLWIHQPGFPIVTIYQENDTNYLLSQHRFLAFPQEKAYSPWWIPFDVTPSTGKPFRGSLTSSKSDLSVRADWFIIHPYGNLARVNYPSRFWLKFIAFVKGGHPLLDTPSIFKLVDDLFAISFVEKSLSIGYAFKMAEALVERSDYTIWTIVLRNLRMIDQLIFDRPIYFDFHNWVKRILEQAISKVGFTPQPGESAMQVQLRGLLLYHAGYYGSTDVIEWATLQFQNYINNSTTSLDSNLKLAIYSTVVRHLDPSYFDIMWRLHERFLDNPAEQNIIASALAESRHPSLLMRLVSATLSPMIRGQDAPSILTHAASNNLGREYVWKFVKNHYEDFESKLGTRSLETKVILGVASHFKDDQAHLDVQNFFSTRSSSPQLLLALESIRRNQYFLSINEAAIALYFTS